MSVKMQSRYVKGHAAITVFQAENDGRTLLSFDKLFTGRRVLGPLFTPSEVCVLLELLAKDAINEFDPGGETRQCIAKHLQAAEKETVHSAIRQAIEGIRNEADPPLEVRETNTAIITVMDPMPKFSYAHTCKKCGCHIESHLRIGMVTLKLCPNCQYVHAKTR